MVLYHGSRDEVEVPDLGKSRTAIDFGAGFYLTEDKRIATKWACRTERSVVNQYSFSVDGLLIKRFDLDKEWLDYVYDCRNEVPNDRYNQYDVVVGPIADDKMFEIFDLYEDGYITAEEAIKVMNCMEYGDQYAIKTERALNNLEFVHSKTIFGSEKRYYKELFLLDRQEARNRSKK